MNEASLPNLVSAARETLASIPNDPRDAALRALIVRLAAEIDATGTTEKLGSRLLTALNALQATPASRRDDSPADDAEDHLRAFLERR